jgi:hypothetical protein
MQKVVALMSPIIGLQPIYATKKSFTVIFVNYLFIIVYLQCLAGLGDCLCKGWIC